MSVLNGVIKTIVADRGFGFIRDDQNRDYFFHVSALPRGEPFGEHLIDKPVSFETEDGPRGPKAVNVKVYENSLPAAG